jgi:hypothetical protein
MLERLQYLVGSKVVSSDEIYDIKTDVEKLVEITNKLVNLVLKNRFKKMSSIYENVTQYMLSIKTIENNTYPKLHDLLMSKLCRVFFSTVNPYGGISATVDGAFITNNSLMLKNKQVKFAALPHEGYTIKEWVRKGSDISASTTNTYEINELTEDATITVEFCKL